MGQYYLAYIKRGNSIKVFDNCVKYKDGTTEYNGLKLMEHSWSKNSVVANVFQNLKTYGKAHVCWVGDYFNEDDCYQVNCSDKEMVRKIGNRVWKGKRNIFPKEEDDLYMEHQVIVNHTKKVFINCDRYLKCSTQNNGWCVHPLPLLTCSASHSAGSYYGVNKHLCGTWFNDVIEVVGVEEKEIYKDYDEIIPVFQEEP